MADPQPLFNSLDPISLILSQNSLQSDHPLPLQLTADFYTMERGPRYREYADLRESKLRMKNFANPEVPICELKQNQPKKQVKFQSNLSNSRKGYSVLAQSVPDFSATLRKENRRPPPAPELTPPAKNWGRVNGMVRGSKSASAGEKRNGMARKSYANVEELKGLSTAAAAAINGDNRGGRIGRTVLGCRQL